MQKKLIALAVAALASTAAFAQTNVTVYGVADGSFDVVHSDKALNPADNVGTINRVSANSSYIGFKGTEDLGNGLKAVFQYEQGFDFTSGAGLGSGAARDSYVGLSSGFGTVVAGNLTGPTRALGNALDVNAGATGIGANSGLIGKFGGSTLVPGAAANCSASGSCASLFDTRWSNAIAYISPTWEGLSFVGAYVADENKSRDGLDGTVDQKRTTGYDVGLKYERAGFMVGTTYNWAQYGDVADTKADNIRVGATYTADWGSVRAMWEQTGVKTAGTDDTQQKFGVGGTYNLGKAALLAQYYQSLESKNASNNGAWLAEVGVQYNLSKRTSLKATYAYLDNESAARNDFGVNAVGQVGNGATLQGLQMGLRHAF